MKARPQMPGPAGGKGRRAAGLHTFQGAAKAGAWAPPAPTSARRQRHCAPSRVLPRTTVSAARTTARPEPRRPRRPPVSAAPPARAPFPPPPAPTRCPGPGPARRTFRHGAAARTSRLGRRALHAGHAARLATPPGNGPRDRDGPGARRHVTAGRAEPGRVTAAGEEGWRGSRWAATRPGASAATRTPAPCGDALARLPWAPGCVGKDAHPVLDGGGHTLRPAALQRPHLA